MQKTIALLLLGAFLAGTSMAGEFLADRHGKVGVDCAACHGPDLKNMQRPTIETCTSCHALDALVEKTKNVKPTNPHTSPHYGKRLDCINCHMGHAESTNFCNQCHQFPFNVK